MTPKQFQVAVYFIGATLMVCVLGIIGITIFTDDPIPDVLQNIAVGSLTGLVGLLVTPRENVQQVRVVDQPVAVEEHGYTLIDVLLFVGAVVGLVVLVLLGLDIIDVRAT